MRLKLSNSCAEMLVRMQSLTKGLSTAIQILLLTSLSFVPVSAQSPDQILEKYFKSAGGTRALKSISNTRLTGTATNRSTGEAGEFDFQSQRPNYIYTEWRIGTSQWAEGFNGKSAWRQDSSAGLRTLTGLEGSQVKLSAILRTDRLLSYKKDKIRFQMLGHETIDHRSPLVLQMTTSTGVKRKLFFDPNSFLLIQEEVPSGSGFDEVSYADYRPIDGVMEPFQIRFRRGDQIMRIVVEQVTHNFKLDERIFDIPASNTKTIPDITSLLPAVTAHQKHLEGILENYTFTEMRKEIEIDKKGTIADKSEKEFQVFFVDGREVSKLIKQNGRELSPDEQRKEEERVAKVIRDHQERQRKKKDEEKAVAEGKKSPQRNENEVTISTFLKASQFANPRRERFRGQEVDVFDFEPRPNFKPHGSVENLIQKLVGVIWIDDNAKQVVRLEARLNDAFKMAGGVFVSVRPGSAFVFEQELVNNEIWLPSYVEVNLSARVFLFAGVNANYVSRYSQYKKFNVESYSEIKPPSQKK
jgi:hypothetical protein